MQTLSISKTAAEGFYLYRMLYTYGIVCMIATKAANITNVEIHGLSDSAFHAFLNQIREKDGNEIDHS